MFLLVAFIFIVPNLLLICVADMRGLFEQNLGQNYVYSFVVNSSVPLLIILVLLSHLALGESDLMKGKIFLFLICEWNCIIIVYAWSDDISDQFWSVFPFSFWASPHSKRECVTVVP